MTDFEIMKILLLGAAVIVAVLGAIFIWRSLDAYATVRRNEIGEILMKAMEKELNDRKKR